MPSAHQENAGYITLERDMSDMLDEMCAELEFGLAQLEGENWSRFVIYLNLPEESEETLSSSTRSTASRGYTATASSSARA